MPLLRFVVEFVQVLRERVAEQRVPVQVLGERGYTDSKKWLPIPQSEIDQAQGTLKQNQY